VDELVLGVEGGEERARVHPAMVAVAVETAPVTRRGSRRGPDLGRTS
jgi:hypothetical protein